MTSIADNVSQGYYSINTYLITGGNDDRWSCVVVERGLGTWEKTAT
ncbi:uncharacterized protein METZ01_LOCUS461415, partial [marine metagenome]